MTHRPGESTLALLLTVAVVTIIVVALVLLGSPARQRAEKLDAARVHDLAAIAQTVDFFRARHHALPHDLAALTADPGVHLRTTDPASGAPYRYTAISDSTFALCADFATDSAPADAPLPRAGADREARVWLHRSGDQCFDLTAHSRGGGSPATP